MYLVGVVAAVALCSCVRATRHTACASVCPLQRAGRRKSGSAGAADELGAFAAAAAAAATPLGRPSERQRARLQQRPLTADATSACSLARLTLPTICCRRPASGSLRVQRRPVGCSLDRDAARTNARASHLSLSLFLAQFCNPQRERPPLLAPLQAHLSSRAASKAARRLYAHQPSNEAPPMTVDTCELA